MGRPGNSPKAVEGHRRHFAALCRFPPPQYPMRRLELGGVPRGVGAVIGACLGSRPDSSEHFFDHNGLFGDIAQSLLEATSDGKRQFGVIQA